MKKLSVIIVTIILVMSTAFTTMGAFHASSDKIFGITGIEKIFMDSMSIHDAGAWYTLKSETGFKIGATVMEGGTFYAGSFFTNDQTFANINIMAWDGEDSTTYIKGGYLFDFGLFAQAMMVSGEGEETLLSVGYRKDFDENTYLAGSIDYSTEQGDLWGFDIDFKHSGDTQKFFGELYIPKELDSDILISVGGIFKINDNLTWGASYQKFFERNGYSAGLTFDKDNLIINGELGQSCVLEEFYYKAGLTYNFSDTMAAGFEYFKYTDAPEAIYGVQFKYKNESLIFNFNLLLNDMSSF